MFLSLIFILIFGFLYKEGQSEPIIHGENVCTYDNAMTPVLCRHPGPSTACHGSTETAEKRVNYPYMVFIRRTFVSAARNNKKFIGDCGGIILQSDIILTAAHCIFVDKDDKIEKIVILAGVKNLEENKEFAQTEEVKGYKIHEEYEPIASKFFGCRLYVHYNDIAILWLKKSLNFGPSVQAAKLPIEFDIFGEIGTAIGWGTKESGYTSSVLQKVALQVMKKEDCQKEMEGTKISKRVFCVISKDKKCGVSMGDSGGPFIVADVVYGLLSFIKAKTIERDDKQKVLICNTKSPQVFTNLVIYKKWTYDAIKAGPPTTPCSKFDKFCWLK